MNIYLGVDGGGTKTICAVSNESEVLATAVSGPSNVLRAGEAQARQSIRAAILNACDAAKVDPRVVVRTCLGVAGASVPEVRSIIRTLVSELVSGAVIIAGDHEIALQAAFGKAPGVIVASGTGSIAYGRDEQGRQARAGGHGFAVSDEGSAHWIGRAAVAAVLQAHDRGEQTELQRMIGREWDAPSRDVLVTKANTMPPPNFAGLFSLVVQAAEVGDAVAFGVLREAGLKLAELASMVINRLWSRQANVGVAMIGGVFQHSPQVRQDFGEMLLRTHPYVQLSPELVNPVLGAVAMARDGV